MKTVKKYDLDGINVDYKGNIHSHDLNWDGLTAFMRLLSKKLRSYKRDSILSICWLFCPTCYSRRTYDLENIGYHVDYFVVMMYDMQWCHANGYYFAVHLSLIHI